MKHMDQASLDAEQQREARDLHRGLKDRHVQLIALGGAIGVGLFLGSGRAISQAGPGLIFAYAAGGIIIFFIMRALGELLLHRPVAGSFATYAEEYVSPFAGFATGWSYWFMWVVTGMAEITAVAIYTTYWFPDMPQWIPALITLGVLYGVNLIAVGLFGELEFWFALIKIVAIVLLLVAGPVVMLFNLGPAGETATVANLWQHGGIFPTGVLGVVLSLQIVMFAFQGVELIGVTAGEVEDPEKSLPRATNAVVYRILIFYIGALIVIMSVMPWTELHAGESPFVMVFAAMGVPAAAGIINFVVITAAASSCNGGLFSTGRMLYTLAQFGQAPRAFGKVSGNHVPAIAITASAAVHADRRRAQLLHSRAGLRLRHQRRPRRLALDLGADRHRAPRLPTRGRARRGGAGQLPDAGHALHQLAGAGLPRPGRDLPRHRRGHPGRDLRRADLVRAARARLLLLPAIAPSAGTDRSRGRADRPAPSSPSDQPRSGATTRGRARRSFHGFRLGFCLLCPRTPPSPPKEPPP